MISNQIQLSKNSKIFIISVARYTSGGPELLHQLAHNLNNLGFNCFVHRFCIVVGFNCFVVGLCKCFVPSVIGL